MAHRALSEQDAIAERARFDLQGRLQRSYVRAINDIERKLKAHLERYEAAEKRWHDRIAKGEATEEDFRAWRMGQEFTGKRWRDMRDQIVADLYSVNQQSVNAVNKERTNVFADNANYEMYELDQHGRMGMGWTVYNRQSVERLLRDDPELLPAKEISKMKDGVWNRKKVNGAVVQGIIQGESIPQIAKRIAEVTGSQNLQQMVSFARTAMTGAQNAGRIDAMHQAQSLGIKLKKRWMATLDHRTRDAHQELDMQTVDVDEPFEVFGQEIMFPGDPNAAPELVMNCRCTLVQYHPEYPPQAMKRRDNETGEVIDAVSYKEWLAMQKQPPSIDNTEIIEKMRNHPLFAGIDEKTRDIILTDIKTGDRAFAERAMRCMDNGIQKEETYINSRGIERKETIVGARWIADYDNRYERAVDEDLNAFLKRHNLNYESRNGGWIFRPDGTYIDPERELFSEDAKKIQDALEMDWKRLTGRTRAEEYLYEQGYPREVSMESYGHWYTTPARKTVKFKWNSSTAEQEYNRAMQNYYDEVDKFRARTDMDRINEEIDKLAREADANENNCGGVTDTFDGMMYGLGNAITNMGGHSVEYYMRDSSTRIGEGVANIHEQMIRGNSAARDMYIELCPNTYSVIREALSYGV